MRNRIEQFTIEESLGDSCAALFDPSRLPICTHDLATAGGGTWIIESGDNFPLTADEASDFMATFHYHSNRNNFDPEMET